MISQEVFNEVLKQAKLGWILEKLNRDFRQYLNIKNPTKHKIIVDAGDPNQTWVVGANSDDCMYRAVVEYFDIYSGHIYAGDSSSSYYDYGGGMRWTDISIPKNATIDSAYLALWGRGIYGVIPETFIEGEDADNAITFSTVDDYKDRDRTSAVVSWTPSEWLLSNWNTSSDIKSVIQEIVNRTGWVSGNALVLFWRDADGWGGVAARLQAACFDLLAEWAPKLEITWTPPVKKAKVANILPLMKGMDLIGFVKPFSKRFPKLNPLVIK